MITLIGSRCTASNRLSRGVLMRRFLLGNVNVAMLCSVLWDLSHMFFDIIIYYEVVCRHSSVAERLPLAEKVIGSIPIVCLNA